MKTIINIVGVVLTALTLSSCHKGGGGNSESDDHYSSEISSSNNQNATAPALTAGKKLIVNLNDTIVPSSRFTFTILDSGRARESILGLGSYTYTRNGNTGEFMFKGVSSGTDYGNQYSAITFGVKINFSSSTSGTITSGAMGFSIGTKPTSARITGGSVSIQ